MLRPSAGTMIIKEQMPAPKELTDHRNKIAIPLLPSYEFPISYSSLSPSSPVKNEKTVVP